MMKNLFNGKKSKKHHIFLWLLMGLILFATISIFLYWKTNLVSRAVEKYLNNTFTAQGTISYKAISGNLINEFIISDISVDMKNGDRYSAKTIRLEYSLLSLIRSDFTVKSIIIDSLSLYLNEQDKKKEKKLSSSPSTPFAFINKIKPERILTNIPNFNLKKLQIKNGHLSFRGQSATFSAINLIINGKKDIQGLNVSITHLSGHWDEKKINLINTEATLKITDNKVQISDSRIMTKKSLINFTFNINDGDTSQLDFKADKFVFDLDEWGLSAFQENSKAGTLSGAISIVGDSARMNLQGDVKGRLSGYEIDNLMVNAKINSHGIKFDRLNVEMDNQQASYHGYYGFDNNIKGRLDFTNLNIKHIVNKGFDTSLNGFIDINASLKNSKNISGNFDLNIDKSRINSLQIDSLHFAARMKNGVYVIVEPSFLKIAENSRFNVSGSIRDTIISLSLKTLNNNLNKMAGAVGIDSLEGNFSGNLNLNGTLFDPNLSGKIAMPLFVYKNIHFDSTLFDLKIDHIVSQPQGEAFFKIHNGNLYDLPIDDITIKAQLNNNVYRFPLISFRSGENYIDAALHYFIQQDTSGIIIDRFRGRYQSYQLENINAIDIYITDNDISLNNFHLIGPNNSELRASGFYERKSDEAALYLALNKISLKPFENFWGKRFELKGVVDGSIDIINPQKNIELNMNIKVDSLEYNETPIGDVSSSFVYFNHNFYMNELRLTQNESELTLVGDLAFSFDTTKQFIVLRESKTNIKVNWNNINIGQYAPIWLKQGSMKGSSSGYFEVHGSVANPMIRHHVTLSDFSFKNFDIPSAELFAQYNRGYIIVDSLGLNLNGSDFSIKGWQVFHLDFMQPDTTILEQPFNLYVHSSGDSLNFLREINDQVYAVYGDYEIELNAGGLLGNPTIESGYIKLNNGEILLSRVLDPVQNVNIQMDIEESLLTVKQFTGTSTAPKDILEKGWSWLKDILPWTDDNEDGGYLSVNGVINLDKLLKPGYRLNISLKDFFIDYFLNNTRLVLNSKSLTVSGRDTIRIAGKIEIPSGEYIVDVDQIKRNIYLETPKNQQSKPLIDEDIEIFIPNDFVISSASMDLTNNFKISINGDLRVIKPPGEDKIQLSGLIKTTSGKYAAWNQMFEINSGQILFDTPSNINPQISIIATKVIKDQTYDLTLSGRLDELEQTIRVTKDGRELNLSDADKLTMLTFGTDLSGLSSHADSTMKNVGGDIATRALLNVMERGAENLTGLDKIAVNSNESLVDFQRMKLNNGLKDASISFGKYITGDLYLEYRTKFAENFPAPNIGWHAGNRIFLEYRLYKRLKIDSFYEATQAGKMKIQLGISWEYDF